jgi:hypothetical protein
MPKTRTPEKRTAGGHYVLCFTVISTIGDELVETAEGIRKTSLLGPAGLRSARRQVEWIQKFCEKSHLALNELEKILKEGKPS